MRAVTVHEFGEIDDLRYQNLPDPIPRAGEVLVSMRAVAVNFVDLLVISGGYQFLPPPPFAPGKLPVGEVTAIGTGVSNVRVGDRVLTLAEQGGYAELIAVPEPQCVPLPDSLTFVDAASMALAFDTAWFALRDRARLAPGESVLVLGAAGAVGHAAVQLAKTMGARVLAGVSSMSRAAPARAAGADAIIDLSRDSIRDALREQVFENNHGTGVDVVLDPLGGDLFDASLRALAWRGRLVVIGFAAGRIPEVKANYLLVKNIEVSGLQVSDYRKRRPEQMLACFQDVFDLYTSGQVQALPSVTYPLDQYAQALHLVRDRKADRRVVMTPPA